jgi:hypothetical protein
MRRFSKRSSADGLKQLKTKLTFVGLARRISGFTLRKKKPDCERAFSMLLLLLALIMSLIRMLMGRLRMLLSGIRMFFALRMIAVTVVLRCAAVGLGGLFVMFGGGIVLVSCHFYSPCSLPAGIKYRPSRTFQGNEDLQTRSAPSSWQRSTLGF